MTIDEVHQLIRTRRSVYPPQYTNEAIPDVIIREILASAITAPTHKLTQPWRFKVIAGSSLKRFGIFMAEKYRSLYSLESFSVAKYEKLKMNPQKAGAIIAICMQRDPKERVPEWEEVAAVAMSVQNMWLSSHAYGIGAYWSTPDLLEYFGEFHSLKEGESCIGLFYMGYVDAPSKQTPRVSLDDVSEWVV